MLKKESSTTEFFTVQYNENGTDETTKIPAKKGKSLKEALKQLYSLHNFSFETQRVFLETSKTPLPLDSDCFPYGGSSLQIRELDKNGEKRKSLLQALSDWDISDKDSTDGGALPKETFDEEFFLESSWKDFVNGSGEMERHDRVQQEAIWELISTEKTYILDLQVVLKVFKTAFLNLQEDGYMPDVDPFLLFANIDDIFEVNVEFWDLLVTVVENSRKSRQPMKPGDLITAFDRFEVLFQPYIAYCNEDAGNKKLPNFPEPTNKHIKEYLNWCDEHPQCKRIKLQGFLIKPLQRVTKYSLLLRAVQSKTIDEAEQEMLDKMRSRVETFVSKINSAVHMRQEHEKLLSVLARLETYTPVEAVNEETDKIMSEYATLDLKGNIPEFPNEHKRLILKEGPMRLLEKQVKKEVQGFLFTDVFILARPKKNSDKYKVIRQPFRLSKTVIRVLKDPGSFLVIYLNEYNVMSNAFVLQINPQEQAEWLSAIEKAKKEYEGNIKKFREKELEDSDDLDFIDTMNGHLSPTTAKRRIRNRFSSRNSTIRGDKKNEENDLFKEWSNTKLIVAGVIFLVVNVVFSKFFF